MLKTESLISKKNYKNQLLQQIELKCINNFRQKQKL